MMHRPVGVTGDGAPGRKATPTAQQVVPEHLAELVVADLADVRRPPAEAGDAAHRVGRRPAAHLDRRAERAVELEGPLGVDQRHRALDELVLVEERVVGVGDHVDERVADADDVVARWPRCRARPRAARAVGRRCRHVGARYRRTVCCVPRPRRPLLTAPRAGARSLARSRRQSRTRMRSPATQAARRSARLLATLARWRSVARTLTTAVVRTFPGQPVVRMLTMAVAERFRYHRRRDPLATPPHLRTDPYRLDHSVLPRRYDVELDPRPRRGHVRRAGASSHVDVARTGRRGSRSTPSSSTSRSAPSTARMPRSRSTNRPSASSSAPPRRCRPDRPRSRSRSPASLNDKLRGFYRSTFTDADGTEQVIATTQMQATDCRRAFPCWDEPEFKAVFAITLVDRSRPRRRVQRPPRSSAPAPRRRQARRALRRHDGDEHLPRGVRRRPARGHRADRRRRHPAAHRARARQGPPHRVRPRDRRLRAALVPAATTASPTRATRSTCSPCPTSPPGRWRTSAASPSARACCCSTPPRARRPSSRTSPTSSPTSSPTCGSATS